MERWAGDKRLTLRRHGTFFRVEPQKMLFGGGRLPDNEIPNRRAIIDGTVPEPCRWKQRKRCLNSLLFPDTCTLCQGLWGFNSTGWTGATICGRGTRPSLCGSVSPRNRKQKIRVGSCCRYTTIHSHVHSFTGSLVHSLTHIPLSLPLVAWRTTATFTTMVDSMFDSLRATSTHTTRTTHSTRPSLLPHGMVYHPTPPGMGCRDPTPQPASLIPSCVAQAQ